VANKETLKTEGHDKTVKVAVPTIVVAGGCRISGMKLTVIARRMCLSLITSTINAGTAAVGSE
jgi:hypothetical protein